MNTTTKRATKVATRKAGRPPENRIKLSLTPLELTIIIEQLTGGLDRLNAVKNLSDADIVRGNEINSLGHKLIAKGIDAGALRGDGSLS